MAPERGAARSGTIGSVQEGEPQKRDDQFGARKGAAEAGRSVRRQKGEPSEAERSARCKKGSSRSGTIGSTSGRAARRERAIRPPEGE
ncbi:hypothetical protein [Paenibacillus ginsengihumi]|uniref:hypothetical protein n=1 Tax=Paenibacillus ginsengihumi TaxID=431596 RepID=UPI000370FC69|nr:hypothetical protein [Paenibacillus ginsengihumi]